LVSFCLLATLASMSQGAVFDSQRGELRVSCIEYEGQVLEAWLTRLPSGQFKLNKTAETSEDCLGARTTASREGDADIPYVKISGKKPQKVKLQRADSGEWVYDLVNFEDTGAGRLVVQFGKQSDTRKKPDNVGVGNQGNNGNNSDKLKGNAAPQDITAAVLKVRAVEITGGGNGRQVIGGAREVDLLNVVNGGIEGLADIVLPEGRFGQLRLILDEGSYVIADGETYPLKVPSGEQSGLKIRGDWGVEGGMITRMELDFNADDIRFNKAQGYRIKPTVKVSAVETAVMPVEPSVDNPDSDVDATEPPEDGNEGEEDEVMPPTEPYILTVDGGDVYGLTLTVPPGAHLDPSSLSANVAVDTTTRLTPVYKLEPEGTKFLAPVTVTLKYNPDALGGFSTNDAGFSPDDIAVLHNGAGIKTIVDAENHTISAEITHFSDTQGGITQKCQNEEVLTNDIFPDVKLKDFYVNSARKLCRFGILHGKSKNGKHFVDPWAKTRVIEVLKVLLSAVNSENRYSGENWTEIMKEIRSDAEKSLPGETIPPSGEAIERGVVIQWISKLFFSDISEADAVKRMVEEGITNGVRMFAKDVNSVSVEYRHCYGEQGVIDNEGKLDNQGNEIGDGVADCVQVNRAELVTLAYRLMNLNRTVNPHGGEQFGDEEQRAAGYRDRETVVLLLHGLNSGAGTWDDLVEHHPTFGNNCPSISVNTSGKLDSLNGNINIAVDRTQGYEGVFCYRLNFGAFDTAAGQAQGLENQTCTANSCSGDWSTFNQLGQEVQAAVNFIKDRQGHESQVILLGHSRGGLAARAFLQRNVAKRDNENRSVRDNIVSMITTGTPHAGSPFGGCD